MARFGAGAVTAGAEVFDLERNGLRSACVDIAQVEVDGRLEILPTPREAGSLCGLATSHAGEEDVEEIRESTRAAGASEIELELFPADVGAITALLLGLLRRLLPVRAENVVFFTFLGVAENFVGLRNLFELFLGLFGVL